MTHHRRLILAAGLVALICAATSVSAQVPDELQYCALTSAEPRRPLALSFCHTFNDEACCIPGHDAENEELFLTMRDVGLSCRIRGDVRDDPIARLYCMNCDPQQPKYVRLGFGANATSPSILIDYNWAVNAFARDGSNLTVYDDCGLLISATCNDNADRYDCGDDLVIPSIDWDTSLSVLDNLEAFLNFENFPTPNIEYYFKIVDSTVTCTDMQVMDENPNCVFTAAQLATRYGGSASDYGDGEKAFSASSAAVFTPVLMTLFVAVAFVLGFN